MVVYVYVVVRAAARTYLEEASCGDASRVEGSTRTVIEKDVDERMPIGRVPTGSDHLACESASICW